jgi:threonine synthase
MAKNHSTHYIYRCFSCEKRYPAADIEEVPHYLCPACGKAEKKQPLQGVLWIEYDYDMLRTVLSAEKFRQQPRGQFWNYPQLWPLDFSLQEGQLFFSGIDPGKLPWLALPENMFMRTGFARHQVLILDETRNPTLSYKDRASTLVAFKALQNNIAEISVASTGNAGSSLAGICARLGIQAQVWVPENIPENKRLQIQAFGARLYPVKGDYDTAFDTSLEISEQMRWYNRNTAFNPLTVEGKKSAVYDLFIEAGRELPDLIFVPVGDGVILGGLYKGFWELLQLGWIDKIPRLIAIQAQGSDALVRFMDSGRFDYQPAHTIADSISAGAPRNLYMAARALQESGGSALTVSDEALMEAQEWVAGEWGILLEPAAAASMAGFLKFRARDDYMGNETVMLLFTGHGLKDVNSLKQWNEKPPARSPEEWKGFFRVK